MPRALSFKCLVHASYMERTETRKEKINRQTNYFDNSACGPVQVFVPGEALSSEVSAAAGMILASADLLFTERTIDQVTLLKLLIGFCLLQCSKRAVSHCVLPLLHECMQSMSAMIAMTVRMCPFQYFSCMWVVSSRLIAGCPAAVCHMVTPETDWMQGNILSWPLKSFRAGGRRLAGPGARPGRAVVRRLDSAQGALRRVAAGGPCRLLRAPLHLALPWPQRGGVPVRAASCLSRLLSLGPALL